MKFELDYIKDVDKLVPCPHIALEVMGLANASDCDLSRLANRVEQDPSLTANMLRFANSAYFGHMKKINSIVDIIVRLGLESVKLIAIAGASAGILKSSQEAYGLDAGQLSRHSFATAVLASIIGRYAKAQEGSALYTAALLHDVGKLPLNDPLQQAVFGRGMPEKRASSVELERQLLNTDHARIGMLLLQGWGLPDKITVPVGMHHTIDHPKSKFLICRIVYLANFLTESVGIHALDPADNIFDLKFSLDHEVPLPEVPGFEANMQAIMEEFHDSYNETIAVFDL